MISDHPFLLMALLGSLLASITGGIIGSYAVVKRIVFICGSISHSIIGGMGACIWLREVLHLPWLHPIVGALVSALASASLIGSIHQRARQREDTIIAALWAAGMAIGVIFISITPGYSVELVNFLFGNILWITPEELWMLALLGLGVVLITLTHHKKFTVLCFDENQLTLQGMSAEKIYFLLLSLIAISVVLLIQVVGALLVIALLAIPPALANLWTKRLSTQIGMAIGISALCSCGGITAAYVLNLPPGATIAALSASAFLILNTTQRSKKHKLPLTTKDSGI